MKKVLGSLLIIILAVLVFLIVARNWVIKTAIEKGATAVTGFNTKVDSVKFDFPSNIQILGLNIQNPDSFKEKTFVNIPEIYANLVLGELLQGKQIHLNEVRLNIQEVHIEKNEKGVSNIELLSSVGGSAKQPAAKPAPKTEQKPAMPFLLDKLVLTIRNVSYEDRSGLIGAAPIPGKKLSMDLNVKEEVFGNIQDPKTLVNLVLAKILSSATLGRLLDIDPKQLLGTGLSNVTNLGKDLAVQSTEFATKQLGNVAQEAKNLADPALATQKTEALLAGSADAAKNALGSTTTAAKDQVSNLFGKIKSLKPGEQTTEKTTS